MFGVCISAGVISDETTTKFSFKHLVDDTKSSEEQEVVFKDFNATDTKFKDLQLYLQNQYKNPKSDEMSSSAIANNLEDRRPSRQQRRS